MVKDSIIILPRAAINEQSWIILSYINAQVIINEDGVLANLMLYGDFIHVEDPIVCRTRYIVDGSSNVNTLSIRILKYREFRYEDKLLTTKYQDRWGFIKAGYNNSLSHF